MANQKPLKLNSSGIASEFVSGDTIASGFLPSDVAYNDNANNWSVSQVPSSAGGKDLGTSALPWGNVYVGGAATNNNKITSASTSAARTFTLPDANSNSVVPSTASTHQFATGISSAGVISYAQPVAGDISGLGTAATENLTAVIADNGSGGLTIGSGQVTGTMIATSVALGGNPTTTTQSVTDNSTKIATTAFVENLRSATNIIEYSLFGGL